MCLLFAGLLLTFIIFAAVLIFLLLQCSHFFATAFAFFAAVLLFILQLFCYLSCGCFLFAFTLGFLATGLEFSVAPFVRCISLLF